MITADAVSKNYDIVLINPGSQAGIQGMSANVGLAAIEAFLVRHSISCRTIYGEQLDHFIDHADVFGISVMDHTYATARDLTSRLARAGKIVVWGGWTATALPAYILEQIPGVTYVILQEGERRLLQLLESFSRPDLFSRIDGIAYRDSLHEIAVRAPHTFLDLDELPIPSESAVFNQLVFIELARGCYGGCRYCQETRTMRFKSAQRAVAEIRHWYDRGYRHMYLGNANSLANGALLEELVAELGSRDLRIHVFLTGRPGDVVRNKAEIGRAHV